MEEIEVKFLDINVVNIENKLATLGATKKYDTVFRDRVFDFPGWPLDKEASWLRLRDKGNKITLSYKKRLGVQAGKNDQGMEEIEIIVDDFDKTTLILERLGMIQKFNEEKRRVHFDLNGIDIDIDTWPLIPPILEIEASSWEDVENTARKLELDWEKRKMCAIMQVYEEYGINEKDYSILTFSQQIKRDQ